MPTVLGWHILEDGCTLHLLVEQLSGGTWRPHAHCTEETLTAQFVPLPTEREAIERLADWFRQRFPDHSCEKMKCRTLG